MTIKRTYEVLPKGKGYWVVYIDGKYISRWRLKEDAERAVALHKYYSGESTDYPMKRK